MGWIERRCDCGSKDGAGCACPRDRIKYRGGVRIAGRIATKMHKSKREAHAWTVEQEASAQRDAYVNLRDGKVPFAEYAQKWWRSRDALSHPAARAADRSRLNTHLLPAFGTTAVGAISRDMVRTWVNTLASRLSPKTVHHCHGLLHQILDAAIDSGLIATNPCESRSGRGTKLPRLVPKDKVALSSEQLQAFVEAHPPHYRPFVVTIAATGLRWSEAAGLTVRYLDLVGAQLRVRRVYSEHGGWRDLPKTDASRRTVSFPATLSAMLAPLVEGKGPDDPVFTTPPSRSDPGGRLLHHGNFVNRIWNPACERAGLTDPRPTPHDLRHTHASLLAAGGMLTVAQKRLGHTKASTTSDIYVHTVSGMEEAALALIEVAVFGVPDSLEGLT